MFWQVVVLGTQICTAVYNAFGAPVKTPFTNGSPSTTMGCVLVTVDAVEVLVVEVLVLLLLLLLPQEVKKSAARPSAPMANLRTTKELREAEILGGTSTGTCTGIFG